MAPVTADCPRSGSQGDQAGCDYEWLFAAAPRLPLVCDLFVILIVDFSNKIHLMGSSQTSYRCYLLHRYVSRPKSKEISDISCGISLVCSMLRRAILSTPTSVDRHLEAFR